MLKSSILIATMIAVVSIVWVASGQLTGEEQPYTENTPGESIRTDVPLTSVRVRRLTAQPLEQNVLIYGSTEASRSVQLRAQTAGAVAEVLVREGLPVKRGQILARLQVEDRKVRLTEAKALMNQRKIEYEVAVRLGKKGIRTTARVAEARAKFDTAKARMEAVAINLEKINVRAPFDSLLEKSHVERGHFLKVGEAIATLIDLDPLHAIAFISERDVLSVVVGEAAVIRLIDGHSVPGKVSHVSSEAEPKTRTFRVEVEIPNSDRRIRAGMTVGVQIPLPVVRAFLVSPAVLTLGEDGVVGVRIVDPDKMVRFVPIRILDDSTEGLWVSGLSDGDYLITVGHEFVRRGQKVRAIVETRPTN